MGRLLTLRAVALALVAALATAATLRAAEKDGVAQAAAGLSTGAGQDLDSGRPPGNDRQTGLSASDPATNPPTGRPGVPLDSLLAMAMRENPRIRAAEASYESARERISPAGALPDPMLMFAAEGAPIAKPNLTNAQMGKVTLTQMFPFPGKQGLMKSSMAEMAAMERARMDRVRLEVAAGVRDAAFELHRLDQSIGILEQSRSAMRDFVEIARTRYANGLASQTDLLKAMVELAAESNRLAVLRAQLPAAVSRLNAAIGSPAETTFEVPALPDTALALPPVESLEAQALEWEPMLRMKESAVRKAKADLRLAGKEGLPDFTLGVEYMNEKEMPDSWTGKAGLTLPIWRGNKVGPMRRGAEQALASAKAERQQGENETRFMVRDSYAMVKASRSSVGLYRGSVLPQAATAFASARAAYETGGASFLDLLDAQRSLLDSQMGYQDALADYLKSWSALGLAVGDPQMLGVEHE